MTVSWPNNEGNRQTLPKIRNPDILSGMLPKLMDLIQELRARLALAWRANTDICAMEVELGSGQQSWHEGHLHNCNTGNVLGNCKTIAVTRHALGIEELSRNGRSGSLGNISSGPESSHDVSFG